MTDLEMTKLCAEAMGVEWLRYEPDRLGGCVWNWLDMEPWDPLHHDGQMAAVVKKLKLCIDWTGNAWRVRGPALIETWDLKGDLNRAVVVCAAKAWVLLKNRGLA